MTTFPGAIVSFGQNHVDYSDTIYAAHVNNLQDEVVAIETKLGTALVTSTWSGTPSEVTTTWTNVAERINNIEIGLKAYGGFAPHPFLLSGM